MFSPRVFAGLLCVLVGTVQAFAQTASCTFTFFQPSAQFNADVNPSGINRYGNVVGTGLHNDGTIGGDTSTAFIRFADGSVKLLQAPGATLTGFSKRNANGLTVGTADSIGGFVFFNNTWTPVKGPGGVPAAPTGINLYGTIVGAYSPTHNAPIRGFRLKNKAYTVINFPGSAQTVPTAISDTGVIVGNYTAADGTHHGFTWTNGVFRTLDNPKGVGTTGLNDINATGTIVGSYQNGLKAFMLKNGVFKDIVAPNSNFTSANGINGFGTITGARTTTLGVVMGYVAKCQ